MTGTTSSLAVESRSQREMTSCTREASRGTLRREVQGSWPAWSSSKRRLARQIGSRPCSLLRQPAERPHSRSKAMPMVLAIGEAQGRRIRSGAHTPSRRTASAEAGKTWRKRCARYVLRAAAGTNGDLRALRRRRSVGAEDWKLGAEAEQ